MNKKLRTSIFVLAVLFSLTLTACGSANLAISQFKTVPVQNVDVQVPLPSDSSTGVELNLEFVVGDLKLSPGASQYLASGSATFNAAEFAPKVVTNGASSTIQQGDLKVKDILKTQKDLKNEWNLQLANIPMSLNINAGPYNGNLELGGLSLQKLTITEVGSAFQGGFSQPNQVEMSSFDYSTGGSTIVLKGLANANFAQMTFSSGAGDYTLSFDGKLQRDARVNIDSGVSTLNIIVPEGVNAKLTFDGGLTSVNTSGAWSKNENVYTLTGSGPTITITVKTGMGTLNLKNS